MAIAQQDNRRPRSSSLADVLEVILDKGIVIDAYVRVSLVGIEILTIDARVVIASVDTYLRFAREVNRLELGGGESTQPRGLPETLGQMQQGGARSKTRGALQGAGDQIRERLGGGDGEREGGGGIVQQATRSLRDALSGDGDDQAREGQEDEEPQPARSSERRQSGSGGGGEERGVPGGRQAPSRGRSGRSG